MSGLTARHVIHIRRPIEDVFRVLTDVELTERWYPARVEERWISPPPHRVGSVRRARVWVLGRPMENDAVVTAHEPPRLAAIRGLSRMAPFEVTLRFVPDGGGTRVEVESIFHLSGPMKVVAPLFVRSYERGWDRGLQELKRLMEAGEL